MSVKKRIQSEKAPTALQSSDTHMGTQTKRSQTAIASPTTHVTAQPNENAATSLTTYEMPQDALIVHAHWINLILDGKKHGKSDVKTY